MQRKEVPAVVAPIFSWFRCLGRRSSPVCISAFAYSLTHLTGLMASPPPPDVKPPAVQAPAQPAAPQSVAEAPKPAPPTETAKAEPAEAPKPAAPENPAAAQPDKPAPNPDPAPAAEPAPQTPQTAQTAQTPPPAAAPAPAPPPTSNLDRIRKAADLVAEVNTALGPPRSPYGQLIYDIAVRHSVNPQLVAAVIHVESAFNPRAVSRKGACGLMQLLPDTARRFGLKKKKDLFDPKKNLEAGVKYLKWLTQRFGGDVQKILAAYNAGEGAVDRFGGIPPYRETQNYVKKIFGLLGFNVASETLEAAPAKTATMDESVPAGR